MVNEIRVYIEGGGDSAGSKKLLRYGFSRFFKSLVTIAREKKIRWRIIMCGPRSATYNNFKIALKSHPNAFNILLVDSESFVNNSSWSHLQKQDGWNSQNTSDTHCHLMVQIMEAWFIADQEALSEFYGQGFNPNAIPGNPNVEGIGKQIILSSLDNAVRNTSKGPCYRKINHAHKLLGKVNPNKVRTMAPHCDRLFKTLGQKMGETI